MLPVVPALAVLVAPAALPDGLLVLLDAVLLELLPIEAFISMKPASLALAVEPVVPVVPAVVPLPRWRHPVNVIVRADELCVVRVVCELGVEVGFCGDVLGFGDGAWAITTAANPNESAAQVPDQIRFLIVPP